MSQQPQNPATPSGRPPGPPPGPPKGPPKGPPPRQGRQPGPPPPPRPPGPPPGRAPGSFRSQLFEPVKLSLWQRIQYPLRWIAVAALLLGAVYLFQEYDLAQYINQKEMQALIEPMGSAAPLAFIGLFVLTMLLMVIPYAALAGLSVLLFGPAMGILWTVIGGTLAAIAVWGISRLFGQRMLARRLEDARWQNLNERLRKDGFYYLLMLRALSIVPFNILNFACAFTSIRFRDFVLANLIGLIPSAFVYGLGLKILLDPTTPKALLYVGAALIALVVVTPLIFRQARLGRRRLQRKKITEAFEQAEV